MPESNAPFVAIESEDNETYFAALIVGGKTVARSRPRAHLDIVTMIEGCFAQMLKRHRDPRKAFRATVKMAEASQVEDEKSATLALAEAGRRAWKQSRGNPDLARTIAAGIIYENASLEISAIHQVAIRPIRAAAREQKKHGRHQTRTILKVQSEDKSSH